MTAGFRPGADGPPVRRDPALASALAEAADLPDGEARLAELDRIAARADALGDPHSALDARFALVAAYLRHGGRWRIIEPVRRLLAAVDSSPDLLDGRPGDAELLRRHLRQAVEAAIGTPRIGLDQAQSLLDALARRVGEDAGVVAQLRCRLADHRGDEPTARQWYDRWTAATDPDPEAGCPGCLPVRRAELLAGWGDDRAALEALRPVLDGGVDCTDQPERALAVGLLPWLRTGASARAGQAHLRAYRRHRRERTALPYLAAQLRFCALAGHPDRALDLLAEQLPRLDHPYDDLSAMEFAAAGALVCALAAESGRDGRRVRRPGHADRPAAELTVAALGTDLSAEATRLAGSFDARNGTGHHAGRIAAWLAERPTGDPVPLPTPESVEDPDDEPFLPSAEEPAPLSLTQLTAVLDVRGDVYAVDAGGVVVGRWDEAVVQFRLLGGHGEILHARVVAARRLAAGRLAEAYEFCNAWNHDRLLPKAYVHELPEGELVLAGDVTTDLAHGVAPTQLGILVDAAVSTGVAYARAVAALP